MPEDDLQLFGGGWTEQKLEALRSYLTAYTKALKKQPFHRAYIDAFAGTGYREERREGKAVEGLFAELGEDEPQKFRDGSTAIALRTVPAFDSFAFIELSEKRAKQLELLKQQYPESASRINIWQDDANKLIQDWCHRTDWRVTRAVVFLDPFGMQVEWKTIQAIAETRAIDLWILFPIGAGTNRMLVNDLSKMPESWKRRLDLNFGTRDWETSFYQGQEESSVFGTKENRTVKTATFESIGQFFHNRLNEIFNDQVAKNPIMLRNSVNSPLYQLHFAAGNPKGAPIALKIAEHILNHV